MRIVVKIISVLAAFAVTMLAIAFFLPSYYLSEYSVEVAVNSDSCLSLLRSNANWSSWMVESSDGSKKMKREQFHPDAQFVQKGINGSIMHGGTIHLVSVDTIWVEDFSGGTLVHWQSKLLCDFPFERLVGWFSRPEWENGVKNSLEEFQKFADESTIGPPVKINQAEAIEDR